MNSIGYTGEMFASVTKTKHEGTKYPDYYQCYKSHFIYPVHFDERTGSLRGEAVPCHIEIEELS
jgi:hypothetical protein